MQFKLSGEEFFTAIWNVIFARMYMTTNGMIMKSYDKTEILYLLLYSRYQIFGDLFFLLVSSRSANLLLVSCLYLF